MPLPAGLAAPLMKWGGIALVVAGLGAAVWIQTVRLDNAQLREAAAREAAEANAKVVAQLQADQQRSAEIVRNQAATLARLEATKSETIREVIRVPVTTQCVQSPAMRLAFERLRQQSADQAPAGGPKAGRQPGAAVPAGPGGAARNGP